MVAVKDRAREAATGRLGGLERVLGQRQVGDVTDTALIGALGGATRRTLGVGPDPSRQLGIGPGTLLAGWCRLEPGVLGRALGLDALAQSLHPEGGGVVRDELEPTHQRVSPARCLAAR